LKKDLHYSHGLKCMFMRCCHELCCQTQTSQSHCQGDRMSSPLMPAIGTLERVLLDAMVDSESGVTFLELVGTGITEENIDQVANNLRNGMFVSENDSNLEHDS